MGMREEFEAAYMNGLRGLMSEAAAQSLMERGSDGEYRSIRVAGAWWGWQESRAAMVLDFTMCNVQYASYNNVDCYSINDVRVITARHGVRVITK